MKPLVITTSDYDVFRNDLLDIPGQECTGEIECAVRDILAAIGEDVEREGLPAPPPFPARQSRTGQSSLQPSVPHGTHRAKAPNRGWGNIYLSYTTRTSSDTGLRREKSG